MTLTFDLSQRFESAFGFVPAGSPLAATQPQSGTKVVLYGGADIAFADIEFYKLDHSQTTTDSKKELFFKLGDFKSSIGSPNELPNTFVSTPMISVSRQKNLIISIPDRSAAEVVENFSKKSYELKIKGIIVDMQGHEYPSNQVKDLAKIFDFDDAFKVVCPFLTDLGIHVIYFTDISIDGVEGYADTLSYSFTARSLQAPEFELIHTHDHI